jgi:SAM-dependent methyltransferase
MTEFEYIGTELELFAMVHNWKSYWARQIRPYILGDVLEVGAGIGTNTSFLNAGTNGRWVCLEPDPRLFSQLTKKLKDAHKERRNETVCGTLTSLSPEQSFDTIVYIDVLEHIENDREELQLASAHLHAKGRLIVLSPAHQKLFTPFDAAIGHFRRYNRRMLRNLSPQGLLLERLLYLDSAGLALSTVNRLFLRQTMPTKAQLAVWDGWVIPVSRILDKCLGNSVGKSIVAIWQKVG